MTLKELISVFRKYQKEGFELVQKDIEEWDYDDSKVHEKGTYLQCTVLLKKVKDAK